MAKEKLTVYQIYYSERTYVNCYQGRKWWKPYNNIGKLTPYFENQVIVDLINQGKHKQSEYFGVFSHDIGKEISFKEKGEPFSPESLLKCMDGTDVFSFQKRRQQENIVYQAENYHPGIVKDTEFILNEIGYEIPKKLDSIILFNHFVMKSDLYERYVKEMLKPAMKVMETMPELHRDAGYKKLKKGEHPDFTEHLGYSHYPIHPFLLERLPSVWMVYNKDLTFKHLF